MSKALFIREAQLERLRVNIPSNAAKYSAENPWLGEYFGSDQWALQSSIELLPDITFLAPTSKTELFDLENTRALFTALRHLTPIQASDERLWAYMAHVTHWNYMRKRWPVEQYVGKPRFADIVQERYFFMPDRPRALIRNGIARLWWYGYTTYDEQREDPFELTAALLKNLDVTQSLLERAFSRNRTLTRAVLTVLREKETDGAPFYGREDVRDLAKYLVQLGGVTIIDLLSYEEMRAVVMQKVNERGAAIAA